METQKEIGVWEEVKSDSAFWKPTKEGEEITGVVARSENGIYGMQYDIQTGAGIVTTPAHKMLQRLLDGCVGGDIVRIVYKGQDPPKKRGENPMSVYQVFKRKR